jgi:hypothetical protein
VRRTTTNDELNRLGAWARSTMGLRPRVPVADIAARGRRRRRLRRTAFTAATTSAVALALAVGAIAFDPADDGTATVAEASRRQATTAAPTTESLAPLVLTALKPLPAREPWPSALITGTLAFEDGCVFLRPDHRDVQPERMLVIWKAGHWLDTSGEVPVVRAPDGAVVGTSGDHIRLAGGGVTGEVVKQLSLVDLRRSCITSQIAYVSGTV